MSKKITYYLSGTSHVVTPDMVENGNRAIPREVANAVKAIAKATKNSENALYTVAYFLNVLNTKNKHGEKPLEKMGYKNIGEYAQAFHNIANSTALGYAQTAEMFLTKDEFGIHSAFANINEVGKVVNDYTVTQLQELRGMSVELLDCMHDMGIIRYGMSTKALRLRKQSWNAITDKEGNPLNKELDTVEKLAREVERIALYTIENKCETVAKAIAMMNAPTEPTDGTTEPTDGTTEPTNSNAPTEPTEPTDGTTEDTTESEIDIIHALENSINHALETVTDVETLRTLFEWALDEIAEKSAD